MKKTEPEYYPPVENLLDLIYEHYTENNPVEKNTVAGKVAKAKEKELEEWLHGLNRLVDDYVDDKIPLWEKIIVNANIYLSHFSAKGGADKALDYYRIWSKILSAPPSQHIHLSIFGHFWLSIIGAGCIL